MSNPFKPGDQVVVIRPTSASKGKKAIVLDCVGNICSIRRIEWAKGTIKFHYRDLSLADKYEKAEVLSKSECDHEWVIYNSGWTKYIFCNKCNIKRSEAS